MCSLPLLPMVSIRVGVPSCPRAQQSQARHTLSQKKARAGRTTLYPDDRPGMGL